jgi:hypothetical protein
MRDQGWFGATDPLSSEVPTSAGRLDEVVVKTSVAPQREEQGALPLVDAVLHL